jgi:hypothetical protein
MKNSIVFIRSARVYHDHSPEQIVPFGTTLSNEFAVDPDVNASGLPAGLTVPIYQGYISAVNTDILARQNTKSLSLTSDEHSKMGILVHATDLMVGYIDSAANSKYPGDELKIVTVLARFGLTPAGHGGKGHKHIFKVLETASGSATLEAPSFGEGSDYHWRWSTDQKTWTQVKSTHKSMVIINNLPHDVRIYFQYDVSMPVGKGKYPVVSALANDFSWSNMISEIIPA